MLCVGLDDFSYASSNITTISNHLSLLCKTCAFYGVKTPQGAYYQGFKHEIDFAFFSKLRIMMKIFML